MRFTAMRSILLVYLLIFMSVAASAQGVGQRITYEDDQKNRLPVNVSTENPLPTKDIFVQHGAFGETINAELTPVLQIRATYGRTGQYEVFTGGGGTAGTDASVNFFATASAVAGSSSALLSSRAVIYNSGQGAAGRFTALYDTPADGNFQDAGFIGVNDLLTFGYLDTTFGINILSHGQSEVQKLTVTTGAGAGENASVTVDGAVFSVPITNSSIAQNACEISEYLNANMTLWEFDCNGGVVTSVDLFVDAGAVSTFDFTSATAVAAWAQDQARAARDVIFIPEADWSERPGGFGNDRLKGNVYGISMQYLGYGAIRFFEENPATSMLETVHIYSPVGLRVKPTLRNPSFRIGWASTNVTNDTVITVKGASAGGFIEGKRINTEQSRGEAHTQVSVGLSLTNIMALRSRHEFNGLRNFGEVILSITGVSTDSTKPIEVKIIKNPIFATTPIYVDHDTNESVVQISTSNVLVIGGDVIAAGDAGDIDLAALNQVLIPGDEVVIAANITSGAASAMTASVSWFEDL